MKQVTYWRLTKVWGHRRQLSRPGDLETADGICSTLTKSEVLVTSLGKPQPTKHDMISHGLVNNVIRLFLAVLSLVSDLR
jgi:hypothetical protein